MYEKFLATLADIEQIRKPWGHEIIWARSSSDSGYIGKVLFIKAGHRLSLQFHEVKEETIFVSSGVLYLETFGTVDQNNIDGVIEGDRRIFRLESGSIFHIPRLMSHRFIAKEDDVSLIEVSTKELDDVVRIKDDYGRE